MHPLPHTYAVTIKDTGDKTGTAISGTGHEMVYAAPEEFDGPGTGWSPEAQLLSSVASCISLTFMAITRMMKVEYSDLQLAVSGIVDKGEDRATKFTEITLTPTLKLAHAADAEKLTKLWDKTEKNCLVSNSLNTPVHINASILL